MRKTVFTFLMVISALAIMAQTYAPTLIAPSQGATGQQPRLMLDWSTVPSAFSYKIEVDTDTNFTAPRTFTSTYGAMMIDNLLYGEKHFWRVKAYGLTDSSDWSMIFSFNVLDQVVMTQPDVNASNRYVKLPIRWTAITGTSFYDYEIDTAASFDSPLYVNGSFAGTAVSGFSKQLHFGENYFIRMRSRHSDDTSSWSAPVPFITIDSFALKTPANNSNNIQPIRQVRCAWTGATHYDFEFSKDSLFTSPLSVTVDSTAFFFASNDTSIRANSPVLEFNTLYYWRARAHNSYDVSKWTEVRTYTTLECVEMKTPVNGAQYVSTYAPLTWKPVEGTALYEVDVDTSALFTNPIRIYVTDTFYTFPYELIPLTTYSWRVRSVTSVDTSGWCPRTFFTNYAFGIDNELNASNVEIYPNPSKDGLVNINLNSTTEDVLLIVTDIFGQEILRTSIASGSKPRQQIDLGNAGSGVYFIQLRKANQTYTRKVVVNR